jgi:hypothetical protein
MKVTSLVIAALLVSACGTTQESAPSAVPSVAIATPAGSNPPASPSQTATVTVTPEPTPTPKPAAKLELVTCDFGMTGGSGAPIKYADPTCQNQSYHINNPVKLGQVVTLTFTVKNTGTKVSGPLYGMLMGCNPLGGCESDSQYSREAFWLPDRFTFIDCNPSCQRWNMNENTGWELQWAGKVAPGKTAKLTVRFRAQHVAYNYVVAGLWALSRKAYNDQPLKASQYKLGEWPEVQIVVF